MPLTDAAQVLVRELRDLAAWEDELSRDLTITRGRSAELTRSLMSLIPVLPRDDRRALKIELAKLEMPRVRLTRRAASRSEIVDAVHAWLAAADDTVTAVDLQAHLFERFRDRPETRLDHPQPQGRAGHGRPPGARPLPRQPAPPGDRGTAGGDGVNAPTGSSQP